jgi:hypothetical protein
MDLIMAVEVFLDKAFLGPTVLGNNLIPGFGIQGIRRSLRTIRKQKIFSCRTLVDV